MISRTNEFVYIKRHYFFPFKPLMDWEYKKFGYKKCDSDRGKHGFFNTAYYVRHKECPTGMYDTLYYINLPFSYFRAIICPILLGVFLFSMLIEGLFGGDWILATQMLNLLLIFPAMLITVILGTYGYKLYRKNDTNGKLDRIMKSHGWPAWTSYRDNDPRFTPPCSESSVQKTNQESQNSHTADQSSSNKPTANTNTVTDNDVISLTAASGEEISFSKIAVIAHNGILYAILQPLELLEGMTDDEALVFRVSKAADGSESFEIVIDDDIINAVFDEYDRLYDESR